MTAIINGTIIDGTGAPGFVGDIFVDGDRIVDVVHTPHPAPRIPHPAPRTIDATGCLVTPGFIDSHTHSDAYLVIEPDAPSKVTQGITTEVNGQCGGSVAPRYGEARLSSDWAAVLGDRLTWRTLAEYREVLEAARPAVNTVQFIGHNTLRSSVVGYTARPATHDELREMIRLLEQSMEEGGHGLTTGLIYQPGKYSTPEEVAALAKVVAHRGGIYATHMRSEGDKILESIDEVVNLARTTGVRAEISHLKTSGKENWGKIENVFEKIERGIAEGVLLGSDRYPYCAAGTDLDIVLPDWAQEGAAKAECARLADDATRRRIAAEIDAQNRDWSQVMIGGVWSEENKPYCGKTIQEILSKECAELAVLKESHEACVLKPRSVHSQASSPGALICSILQRDECKTGAFFKTMCEENLAKILAKAWVVPGTDASLRAPWGILGNDHPHPRAYGTMPEFYRRVRELGFTTEETVARMTSVPAKRFGLAGRGVVEKGAYADLVVWKECEFKSNATYLNPHRFASGVQMTMVNGKICWQDGKFTNDRAGRFL